MQRVGVTGLFLGHYIPWDGLSNALLAQAHGFETWPTMVEGSLVNYENLDNEQMRIHDYFKYLKYGYGRATDWACWHIRRGRMSREDGIELVRKHDGKFPWKYLGVPIEDILNDISMSLEEFQDICDKFTNRKLFVSDRKGNLVREADGSLVKINYDNIE